MPARSVVVSYKSETTSLVNGVKGVNVLLQQTDQVIANTNRTLGQNNKAAMAAGKGASSLGDAMNAVKTSFQQAEGAFGKTMAATNALRGSFVGLTGGIKALNLVIKQAPKLFNPIYGASVWLFDQLVDLASAFFGVGEDAAEASEKLDTFKESADTLAKKLGSDMTLISAEQAAYKIAAEKAKQEFLDRYATTYERVKQLTEQSNTLTQNLREATIQVEKNIKTATEDLPNLSFYAGPMKTFLNESRLALTNEQTRVELVKKATSELSKSLEKTNKELEKQKELLKEMDKERLKDVLTAEWEKGRKKRLKDEENDENYLYQLRKQLQQKIFEENKKYQGYSKEIEIRFKAEYEEQEARRRIKNAKNLERALYLIRTKAEYDIRRAVEKDEEEAFKRSQKRVQDWQKLAKETISRVTPKIQTPEKVDIPEGEESQKVAEKYEKIFLQNKQMLEQLEQANEEFYNLDEDEAKQNFELHADLIRRRTELLQKQYKEELQLEKEMAIAKKKDYAESLYNTISLSKANKNALRAQVDGLKTLAEGLDAAGVSSNKIQAMEMIASGVKAGADAIDYSAQAAREYALGNVFAGAGLTAAAVGKVAAVAAYIKGLTEIGQNKGSLEEPNLTKSSSAGQSAQALSGDSNHQQIDINMMYSWGDSKLAQALIQGLNATATTPGMTKINPNLIARN